MSPTPEKISLPLAVRISKIAGRYLVFDAEVVAVLRRQHQVNGVLVGTTPQQPTQNIFSGLPVELRPEEACVLLERGAAYIADDVVTHNVALREQNKHSRLAYTRALELQKLAVQTRLADMSSKRAVEWAPNISKSVGERSKRICSLTPTSSRGLIPRTLDARTLDGQVDFDLPIDRPLCRFLYQQGYYMTPGLRFGARYSVYPGDPLRFHAHFMANQYEWHHEIPILDIVSNGRLATAVKKSFLIGSRETPGNRQDVTMFSIEWAAL